MIALRPDQYAALAAMAETEAGLHMPPAKRTFVTSRLQRRLRRTGLADFDAYLGLLNANDAAGRAERRHFVSALTTNVTGIYREPHHFDLLADRLRAHLSVGRHPRFRVWSAGCSTGEEPLSIAAVCRTHLGPMWAHRCEILATDVDAEVIEAAGNRTPDAALMAALSRGPVPGDADPAVGTPERLFASLQSGIRYTVHNLLHPLEETLGFDAIFCRNVTIYFSPPAQTRVHANLRAQLRPGGLLALGHSERLRDGAGDLRPVGRTAFQRTGARDLPSKATA
ncbi:CheR family methyltransferase [Jannaschia marina]|uniref:CheR family methyltransferase n=1 Tax=Jannaschia marina TaxID=2741674 RepID=UPI0015C9F691|nr:protein-glutamate O-methyltransferase CheR [Jannaschia marina]